MMKGLKVMTEGIIGKNYLDEAEIRNLNNLKSYLKSSKHFEKKMITKLIYRILLRFYFLKQKYDIIVL